MHIRLSLTAGFVFILAGCAGTPEGKPTDKQWQPTTLSDRTIKQARQSSRDYFGCIQDQLAHYRYRGGDSRYETEALLKPCEKRLEPIRTAFAEEGVDPRITRRYLKRKRTQAARHVLRLIMAMEAQYKTNGDGHESAQAGG
ncbi:hypothetical protein [Methylohalobius crimeensis]|uniref:hypothetical protein n=1 Tax=Methylohalobius crimeensis TaxID=244365 RepID=UPI0004048B2F|nr:hypothetical protein [Methylohalobius crimeensis]